MADNENDNDDENNDTNITIIAPPPKIEQNSTNVALCGTCPEIPYSIASDFCADCIARKTFVISVNVVMAFSD